MRYDAICSQSPCNLFAEPNCAILHPRIIVRFVNRSLYLCPFNIRVCKAFCSKNRRHKLRRLVERFHLNSLLVSIAQFLISLTLCGKRRETFWPGITINVLKCTPSTNKRSNMCMLRSKIIHSHRKFVNGSTARRHRILERHLA